ncbi:hypothetical protein [Paracoccus sphaerophysae]|uniref:hypothetical protein n=1 Tax=Paracoccus sphaerophysae TaxID=690417 RepID=UPI0012EC8CE1|nr:hypothetical protein [Paracoccus sphaerophysae]
MTTNQRACANGPGLPDVLERHLSDCHAGAVQAVAVAEAVEMLVSNGLAKEKATGELLAVLIGMIAVLEKALDVVNLPKGEAA